MSRLLITGATGLIGSVILQKVIDAGHSVVALSRNPGMALPNVQWVQADFVNDIRSVLRNVPSVDAVIHNAASLAIGRDEAERTELEKINLDASRALIDWSVLQSVQKLIFSSSINLLAKPLPKIITEDVPASPSLHYHRTKIEIERELAKATEESELQTFIFRISSPVSLNPAFLPRTVLRLWIEQAKRGEDVTVFGSGSRTQDFICVNDIAALYERTLHSNSPGLYNLASGTTLSMLELAEMIAGAFGVKICFQGEDENENDRWNISIEMAQKHLKYSPKWTSRSVISELLKCFRP